MFGRFLSDFGSAMTDPDILLSNTIDVILIFVYMGTATLVGGYITHALWVLTGERQARRIRKLYLHSILRQDMTCTYITNIIMEKKRIVFLTCNNK